ncbi:hypothetical protein LCGC14_2443190 [marine sediment metagenome]|uniref:Uncharacterized protein n=1 Tax=marine sediment metagenome TaxID=412755 RepID=A0A0F9C5T2_9ZZZZ
MNSWAMLLLLDMNRGKYLNLSPRLLNQYDWIALWALIQEQQPMEVKT